MTIPSNPMLRFFEMSCAYRNMEHMVGGSRGLREKFGQAEKAFRQINFVTVPHDLKQAWRVAQGINDPNTLIVILEEENFDLTPHHYKQALGCFDHKYYGPCNGEIRNVLEALLLEIYTMKTGKEEKKYYRAVDLMKNLGLISHEEREILKEVKRKFNTNGSHPGRSTKQAAETRLHQITFIARFCLYRILRIPENGPNLRITK